ncbi:MAG: QueT transporter family protein [Thermoproteota archaeon]
MNRDSHGAQELVLTSIIAATYGAGTIAISPIGYGPIQARLTDALIPTSYNKKVGRAAIVGTALGCIIANIISPYGLPDILIGTLANLLASGASYAFRNILGLKGKILATLTSSIIIGVAIGGVLLYSFYGAPLAFTILTVTAGELVSCVGIGIPLLEALERIFR